MEMRVREVGVHAVNLGLYSRDGWSHLGPLVFYTLAAPYRIFGSSTAGMVIGALTVNAAAVVAMVAIARRLAGRRVALVVLLLVSVLIRAMGAQLLANPWVLFITVLPFGVFCLVVWALVLGRSWALPAGAALATWLVQTHVGYVPIAIPLLGAGTIVLAVVAFRAGGEQRSGFLRASALRRHSRCGLVTARVGPDQRDCQLGASLPVVPRLHGGRAHVDRGGEGGGRAVRLRSGLGDRNAADLGLQRRDDAPHAPAVADLVGAVRRGGGRRHPSSISRGRARSGGDRDRWARRHRRRPHDRRHVRVPDALDVDRRRAGGCRHRLDGVGPGRGAVPACRRLRGPDDRAHARRALRGRGGPGHDREAARIGTRRRRPRRSTDCPPNSIVTAARSCCGPRRRGASGISRACSSGSTSVGSRLVCGGPAVACTPRICPRVAAPIRCTCRWSRVPTWLGSPRVRSTESWATAGRYRWPRSWWPSRASEARARRLFDALDAHEITGDQFLAKYNRLNKELGTGVVLLRDDDSLRSSR